MKRELYPRRHIKGIWIPIDIWTDQDLTPTEKCLLAEIDSLSPPGGGCFAKDEHLALFLQCEVKTLQNRVSELIKKKYLRREGYGRSRTLHLTNSQKGSFPEIGKEFPGNRESTPYYNREQLDNIYTKGKITSYREAVVKLSEQRSDIFRKNFGLSMEEYSRAVELFILKKEEAGAEIPGSWKQIEAGLKKFLINYSEIQKRHHGTRKASKDSGRVGGKKEFTDFGEL